MILDEEIEIKSPPVIRRAETGEPINIEIPICCREGHPDCPHVAKPPKKKKQNVGL